MFKNINKIFAATALVAIALTSCTDEADVLDNKPIKNKKTGEGELYVRPYPAYDTISYSSSQTYSMLSEFNEVINSESTLEDMSIGKAMYVLEAYTNYGVIDKANSIGEVANDVFRTFELTLPVSEGQIDGAAIKEAYQNFIVSFLYTMSGKVIPLADMYVKELSSTSVTFGLDINPMNVPVDPNARWYFPEFYQPNETITVPQNISSNWGLWKQNQATPWESWTGVMTGQEVKENNVYRYSQKIISTGYNTYYTGVQYDGIPTSRQLIHFEIDTYNPLVSFDYLALKNTIIPLVIEKQDELMINYVQNWLGIYGKVLCDCDLMLSYGQKMIGSIVFDGYFLNMHTFTFATKNIATPPAMNYVTAFTIADIHPEL